MNGQSYLETAAEVYKQAAYRSEDRDSVRKLHE